MVSEVYRPVHRRFFVDAAQSPHTARAISSASPRLRERRLVAALLLGRGLFAPGNRFPQNALEVPWSRKAHSPRKSILFTTQRPRSHRNCTASIPLGNAARATRRVSWGMDVESVRWNDLSDLLLGRLSLPSLLLIS